MPWNADSYEFIPEYEQVKNTKDKLELLSMNQSLNVTNKRITTQMVLVTR